MRLEEKLEGLKEVLTQIRKENEDKPILVEGKKDVEALRDLGMKGEIIEVKRGDTIFHTIEDLRGEYEEVIILTDWDRSGARLDHKIRKACEANVISYNNQYRKKIIMYVKKEVKDVEALPAFIERAERIVSNPHEARRTDRDNNR